MVKSVSRPSYDKVLLILEALSDGTISNLKAVSPAYREAAATIHEKNPEYIELALGYLAMESKATDFVLENISFAIGTVASEAKDPYVSISAHDMPSSQRNDLMYGWNFHDIAAEINAEQHDISYAYSNLSLSIFRKHGLTHAYWRGVTVLCLSLRDKEFHMEYGDHEDFIQWAGQHPNVGAIIDMVRERKTIDFKTIHELVDDHKGHSSLRNGVI